MDIKSVKGTRDLLPQDWQIFQFVRSQLELWGDRYSFQSLDLPILESTSLFARGVGDSTDIVNKEMYSFVDRGGDSITLRPEGTAQIARTILENNFQRELPKRLMYFGPMFRYERPQKGRYRQFYQAGAEWVGAEGAESDIETIAFAHDFLMSLHLPQAPTLEINTLGDTNSRLKYREVLTSYLGKHHDKLSEESQKRLKKNPLRVLDSKQTEDAEIVEKAPQLTEYLSSEAREYFDRLLRGLEDLNISFVHRPTLVRGLDYYSHTVFEFVTDQLGAQNALLAGGRYDGLFESLGGPVVPSIGWAAGIDRLALLCQANLKTTTKIALLPLTEADTVETLKLSYQLRQLGLSVECLMRGQLGKRFKKAHKGGSHFALILGGEEAKASQVALKNLETGEQRSLSIEQVLSELTQNAKT